MKLVIKIGGAQLDSAAERSLFAASVGHARSAGHDICLIHGGGKQLGRVAASLGLSERRWRGLRITDAETAEAGLMTLAGSVNRRLVHALELEGVSCVGLCGADGSTFGTRAHPGDGSVALGHVGIVDDVDPSLALHLMSGGFTPVIATMGPRVRSSADAPFDNVNADHAVAPIAKALGADAVLFLTDVSAVRDADGNDLRRLDTERVRKLESSGALEGGMLPKVESALAAAQANRGAIVTIASGRGEHAVSDALSGKCGTRLIASSRNAQPDGVLRG